MLEILLVIGFFLVLLLTGISIFGVIAALVVGVFIMLFTGLLALALKLLPWLLLALVVSWIWRAVKPPQLPRY